MKESHSASKAEEVNMVSKMRFVSETTHNYFVAMDAA